MHTHLINAVLILFGTAFTACLALYAAWKLHLRSALIEWYKFWAEEGNRVASTAGYLTPYISRTSRAVRCLLVSIFVPLVIGPVRIVGRENLKGFKGKLVWASNHRLYFDAMLFARFFRFKAFRFMIKCDQVRGPQGFGLAWLGAISVAVPGSSARKLAQAIYASVDAEQQQDNVEVIVCPEGALHPDGVLARRFWESGVFRIAQRGQLATGIPHAIAPLYIAYDHDPAHQSLLQTWVRKTGLMRKMHQLALGKGKVEQRQFGNKAVYGATIYIGKLLPVSDLPQRPRPAMDRVFEAELELEANQKRS
jgi:1-acyl-sn-glycerol-3-phosphate acyltransferase